MLQTQTTVVARQLAHKQKENLEFQKANQVLGEEIEDLQEQVEIKRRAPISKKRESDVRLANAKQLFGDERRELEKALNFVVEGFTGYQLIGWDDSPGLRLRVNIDDKRFFIVQLAQYGEKKPSKQRPKVRFSDETNRSQSIPP